MSKKKGGMVILRDDATHKDDVIVIGEAYAGRTNKEWVDFVTKCFQAPLIKPGSARFRRISEHLYTGYVDRNCVAASINRFSHYHESNQTC